jgi:hypothetical protein
MGGSSSKAESAYKETQLSEFAAQYKNADMPQLRLAHQYVGGLLEGLKCALMPNKSQISAHLWYAYPRLRIQVRTCVFHKCALA